MLSRLIFHTSVNFGEYYFFFWYFIRHIRIKLLPLVLGFCVHILAELTKWQNTWINKIREYYLHFTKMLFNVLLYFIKFSGYYTIFNLNHIQSDSRSLHKLVRFLTLKSFLLTTFLIVVMYLKFVLYLYLLNLNSFHFGE